MAVLQATFSCEADKAELVQLYGGAAALFDAAHACPLAASYLTRTQQRVGDHGEGLGLAEGAGMEGAVLLLHVARDVEGVALAVAEAVDDGARQAALLAH